MSRQPEPPASMVRVFRHWYGIPASGVLMQAVWDALVADGRIMADEAYRDRYRFLVIPLPVVEPRDTEHA